MAKKEDKAKPKQVLERTYNIPLRKKFLKAPRHKRAKRAISGVRQFLERHMKGTPVRLGKHLNEKLWERGIKNPPHHVKVSAVKYEDNSVKAELTGFPVEEPEKKPEEKKEKKKEAAPVEKKQEKKEAKEPEKNEVETKAEPEKVEDKPAEEPKKEVSK